MNSRFMPDYPQLRALWLAIFTDVLGMSIILPILPVLAIQYQINAFLLGFLIASNAIFGFIVSPLLGKSSDKYGRKPILLICQIGTIMGFIVLTFSNSLVLLLLARIIDGIFSGQLAVSQAVVSDIAPPQDRGKIMTTIGSAFTFAYIFGPSVGGIIYQGFGILGLGLLAVSISSFNLLYTIINISESHPSKILHKPNWMIATQSAPLIQKTTKSPLDSATSSPETPQSPQSSSIILKKSLLYILILYGVFILVATPFESTISLFSYVQIKISIVEIGLLFSCMAVFQVTFRVVLFKPIHKKLGDTKCILLGFLIYLTAYFFLSFSTSFWYYLFVMMYLTLGAVFTRGILVGFASRIIDERSQGKLMGIITSIENLGQIIGPFIGTYLLLELNSSIYLVILMSFSAIALFLSFGLFRFRLDTK